MIDSLHHDFVFAPTFRLVGRALGVTPGTTGVDLDDVTFTARFGPWTVSTPITNLEGAEVTGPYAPWRVIGPPHLSLADSGLTFATNRDVGVCIRFREAVTGLLPLGLARHPGLTVTVAEPAALAEVVEAIAAKEGPSGPTAEHPIDEAVVDLRDSLAAMSASDLRARAHRRGVPRASGMSKAQLIDALSEHEDAGAG